MAGRRNLRILLAVSAGTAAFAAGMGPGEVATAGVVVPGGDVSECAVTWVHHDGLRVAAPARGHGTSLVVEHADGTAQELTVVTNEDCSVQTLDTSELVDEVLETVLGPAAPETPNPCASAVGSAHTFLSHKAYSDVGWYYNLQGEPVNLLGGALAAITKGATNMADGFNDCGITTVPRTSFHTYRGPTTVPSGANGSGCTHDRTSVVGWGQTPAGVLASACVDFVTTSTPYRLTELDMTFSVDRNWAVGEQRICLPPNEWYDVEGIATHEWGHVFGLGHVAESGATATQTMSVSTSPCSESYNSRTLGRGDLNGMIARYGGL